MDGNELNRPLPSQEITALQRTKIKEQKQLTENLIVPLPSKNMEQRDNGVTQTQGGVIQMITHAQIHGETSSSTECNKQMQQINSDMDMQLDIANQLILLGSQQQSTNSMEIEIDEEPWTGVPSKKRKNNPGPTPIPTPRKDDNYYSLLDNFVILSSGESDQNSNVIKTKSVPKEDTSLIQSPPKFCPPIIIYKANIKKIIDDLKSNIPDLKIKVINVNRNKSKLFVDNVRAHSKLMEILKNCKEVEAHSYTPKELKRVNLVLRGLNFHYSVEDIKKELDEQAPGVVESVSQFETIRSKEEGFKYNLFLVKLHPDKQPKDILGIKYICYSKITWERPKGNKGILQCRRCQAFGHLAKNCARNYNCVKCEGNHEPGGCQLKKTENSVPYCINCKQFDHPANFKGCPHYENYLHNRKTIMKNALQKRETNQILTQTKKSNSVTQGTPFADLFKKNPKIGFSDSNSSENNPLNEFFELSEELFGTSVSDLMSKISNFIKKINQIDTIEQKRIAYLKLLNEVLITKST